MILSYEYDNVSGVCTTPCIAGFTVKKSLIMRGTYACELCTFHFGYRDNAVLCNVDQFRDVSLI